MQSLFDTDTYNSVVERMNQLTAASEKQWGKMNVAQMLAHCKEAFQVPLSEKPMPRMLLGLLIGWAFKSKLYNDEPWKKNLPTAPSFIIKDERNFDKEKQELMELVHQFYTRGPGKVGQFAHPMFGKLTSDQWGKGMFKHLDHHLHQFGL
jgi:hypothetical protein